MNTQNVWIKRSEREPTEADIPIRIGYYNSYGKWDEYTHVCLAQCKACPGLTHWRSVKADPPPRELTQREKDEEMVQRIHKEAYANSPDRSYSMTAARLAIYAERLEVAKLMEEIHGRVAWEHGTMWNDGLVKLRARLDEQGTK